MRRVTIVVVLLLVATGCRTPWLELVSRDAGGDGANGHSTDPALSATGRYVAFTSSASDLVPGDTNGKTDVFIRDLKTRTVELISVGVGGAPADGASMAPSVSADGRLVVFYSDASNLASDVVGRHDVFLRDRSTQTTTAVSKDFIVGEQSGVGFGAISADGSTVWFTGAAEFPGIMGHTLIVYDVATASLSFVPAPNPFPFFLDGVNHGSVSADGRYAAVSMFTFPAPQVTRHVYRVDRVTGAVDVVPQHDEPTEAGPCWSPSISADGGRMAFVCATNQIVPGATATANVYARDLPDGTTFQVSVDTSGGHPDLPSDLPSLSSDGSKVAFASSATDLVPSDGNGTTDVFVRDLVAATTTRVSLDRGEAPGSHGSPSIGDGELVAFTSDSNEIVPGDSDGTTDVLIRAVSVPTLISATPAVIAAGSSSTVTLTGSAFRPDAVVSVSPATGITVNTVSFVSPTELDVTFTVDPSATAGARTITVLIPGPGAASSIGSAASITAAA